MRERQFTDCVDIVGSSCKPFEGNRRYISTGAVATDHIDENDVEIVDYKSRPSRADLIVEPGTLLFAKMQGTKKTLYVDKEKAENIYSTGFFALKAKSGVSSTRCLYHMLGSTSFLTQKDKNCSGATQKAITNAGLKKIRVSIPDYQLQEAIADQLDKISSVIQMRRSELQKLDDLVKARFVEMFGIPFVNDKHWVTKCIGEVVTEVRYGTSRPAVEGGKYPYLRMNNLTNDGEIDLNNLKYIDIPDDEVEKCIVRKGDVLFNRTNSAELVGKTAMFDLDEEMIIAGYIIRVRLQSCLRPEILSQYMNLKPVKELLHSMAKGAVNQANINAQELQRIEVYIPHIELQREFVAFKKQLDKSKFVESIHVLKLIKEAIAKEVSHDRIR